MEDVFLLDIKAQVAVSSDIGEVPTYLPIVGIIRISDEAVGWKIDQSQASKE